MVEEQKKIVKIIGELTMYFLEIGADRITSRVDITGRQAKITFHANYHPGCERKLHELEKCLNEQRNDGIEDIYWELAGTGNHGETSQLMLVGIMVDRAEVEVKDGYVDVALYKELKV